MWPSPCSVWWCCVSVWIFKGLYGENSNRHYNWNFDILAVKMACLIALLSFLLSPLSSLRSHLSELSLFGFPLLKKSKGYTLDSRLTPARSEKKGHWNPTNHTNSSAKLLYKVKHSFSPKRTLQSSKFEGNTGLTKLMTLNRGRERSVLCNWIGTLLQELCAPFPWSGSIS